MGGGAIIFTEKYRLRTISKHFLTVLRMVCKLKLVRRLLPQKIWGSSEQRLIFGGPKKSEDPYFPNSESKRNREIKIFFDFFQWLPKLNRGVPGLNFFLIVSLGYILSVYIQELAIFHLKDVFFCLFLRR